jgi:transcriptional regulator of acetoin/glycerol metabolism
MLVKVQVPKTPRFQVWDEFTKTGELTQSVNPRVASSWSRCLRAGMDASGMNLSGALPAGQLRKLLNKNAQLLDASRSSLEMVERIMCRTPYAVLLCDPKGNIIYQSGSGEVSDCFGQAGLVAGGNCSEEVIGTTAPGIVLVEEKPSVVLREEHYDEIYHWCCCSASPIYDIEGRLTGCLDFTLFHDQAHHIDFLFGLNVTTAKSIQSSLHIQQLLERMEGAKDFIDSTSNLTKERLLILECTGRVLHANEKAADLLGLPVHKLLGEHYQQVMESAAVASCLSSRTPKRGRIAPRQPDARGGWHFVQARPLHDREGRFLGSLLILEEGKKTFHVPSQNGHAVSHQFQSVIGRSTGIRRAVKLAQKFADSDVSILLQGDTGTGKEMFAQAIHNHSSRRNGPFVPVNCAAIPGDLVESELFGYKRGAFTGALREGKKGKFEMAEGGSLFLDEIDSMSVGLQAKLLRAVEDGEIVQLGGHTYKHIDVRIIAASSVPLDDEIRNGRFRKDLFYRLSLVRILLPPLAERMEDLDLLAHSILEKCCRKQGRAIRRIHPDAMETLCGHDWPGNIRELENCLEFGVCLAEGDELLPEHLPDYLAGDGTTQPGFLCHGQHAVERSRIERAIELAGGDLGEAARQLGVSRSTLYRKRKQLGILGP